MTYIGAAAGLWACASGLVPFRNLVIMQFANTFAATTTPAGVGGLALSTRFLQKAGLGTVRATAAVAVQQAVQVITHVALLIFFSVAAGASADLSHFVPKLTLVYLIIGVALGAVGAFLFVPKLRNWLDTAVRPKINEVGGELIELVRDPKRFAIIVLGCAGTTLGAALALWASVEAFGGGTTFVTVTVVTMVGGTLAAAAPTPGGVGAVVAWWPIKAFRPCPNLPATATYVKKGQDVDEIMFGNNGRPPPSAKGCRRAARRERRPRAPQGSSTRASPPWRGSGWTDRTAARPRPN
jgi:hypothetical protein